MCGVFGIVAKDREVSPLIFFGLFALQHRGQESAGIATSDSGRIFLHKAMGTIDWVFRKQIPLARRVEFIQQNCDMPKRDLIEEVAEFEKSNEKEVLEDLRGRVGIGHVRYSTTGASGNKNIHPILFYFKGSPACIAHNGNIIGLKRLQEIVQGRGGYNFEGNTDTELIAALIATSSKDTFFAALLETLPLLNGAFSLVLLYEDKVYAIKDKFGIRPLCVGKTEQSHIVASETCALDTLEAEFVKELDPGEGVILEAAQQGPAYFQWTKGSWRSCLFDSAVYFSRPDSAFRNREAHEVRGVAGGFLAREYPVFHADIVIPVPDSGNAPALGYARGLRNQGVNVEYEEGLLRPHFVGRTFIEPAVELRHEYRRTKYNPIRSVVKGKVIVVVDDSVMRGTTMPYVVRLLKRFGAKEVHVRIAAPPTRYGCHLGVDLPSDEDLIAHGKSVEQVREWMSTEAGVLVNSLEYLSLSDLIKATELPADSFCTGCWDKNWPVARENEEM